MRKLNQLICVISAGRGRRGRTPLSSRAVAGSPVRLVCYLMELVSKEFEKSPVNKPRAKGVREMRITRNWQQISATLLVAIVFFVTEAVIGASISGSREDVPRCGNVPSDCS